MSQHAHFTFMRKACSLRDSTFDLELCFAKHFGVSRIKPSALRYLVHFEHDLKNITPPFELIILMRSFLRIIFMRSMSAAQNSVRGYLDECVKCIVRFKSLRRKKLSFKSRMIFSLTQKCAAREK